MNKNIILALAVGIGPTLIMSILTSWSPFIIFLPLYAFVMLLASAIGCKISLELFVEEQVAAKLKEMGINIEEDTDGPPKDYSL
jgi:hypothetical protein